VTTGFVYVIESPSPADLLDGRTEGRVLSEALALAGIAHTYSVAADALTFDIALGQRLVDAWKQHQQPPILHLSMHGNAEGVGLTNGDFLTWDQLRAKLLPLLRILPNALLICMSSCFGYSGCRLAMYLDNEPHFWALVGHPDSVNWADAAVAYVTFYHLFFKGEPVTACVEAMKTASGDSRFLLSAGAEAKKSWADHVQRMNYETILALLAKWGASQAPVAGSSTPNPTSGWLTSR
jgi:hypothetical protein